MPVTGKRGFESDWLALRAIWEAEHGVPVEAELHSNKFLAGRGRFNGLNPARVERYRMAQSALDLIGCHPGVVPVAVYTHARHVRTAKTDSYAGLLRALDRGLAESGERADLIVDGDGTERLYVEVHEAVRPTRIACPAVQVPAHESLWIQAADLIAYCAFQAVARQPERAYMWHWYAQHLPKAAPPQQF